MIVACDHVEMGNLTGFRRYWNGEQNYNCLKQLFKNDSIQYYRFSNTFCLLVLSPIAE